MASATVLRASGGVYDVELDDGTVAEASLRGRLKLERRTGDRVVAGDMVDVIRHDDGSFTIEAVAPRRSELARRAPGHGRKARIIVANIDRVIIVFATADPAPRRRMLDRFLVIAEANHLEPVIVINKIEVVPAEEVDALLSPYVAAGYETLRTSASSGAGVAELRECLRGARSVVTGPSGVGKSSLLNAVEPGLGLRIGEVSRAVHKGQHTTVTAQLIPLDCGGYVADTPGLRELGLWNISPEELPDCFPEFRELAGDCRFGGSCTHVHEPDCVILDAVRSGEIDADRYESYRDLRLEAAEAPRH
jgi:ribosome biogenesis GTPase / thiamine phosphate phosphatase